MQCPSQPTTWTQTPTHLPNSVSRSLIYHSLEDKTQQMYQPKNEKQKTFYGPTKMLRSHLHTYQSWKVDKVRRVNLPQQPPSYFDCITPFLETLQYTLVVSLYDLNFLSWVLNSTSLMYLTTLIPCLIHLISSCGTIFILTKEISTAQLNKAQHSYQITRKEGKYAKHKEGEWG